MNFQDCFHIMPSRLSVIKESIIGYDSTQTFLVGLNPEHQYIPIGILDDIGQGVLVTILKNALGVSIDLAYPILASLIIMLGFVIVQCAIHQKKLQKLSAILMTGLNLIIAIFVFFRGDVYTVNYIAAAILFYFIIFDWSQQKLAFISIGIFTLLLVIAELVRSKSGLGVVISLLIIVWIQKSIKNIGLKIVYCTIILFIFSFHFLIVKHLSEKRNDWFLIHQNKNISSNAGHPVWHSIYIGLGIVDNKYDIVYDDKVAFDKGKSIGGDHIVLCSKEYETILKVETLKLLKEDPVFVFKALGLKTLICLLVVLILSIPIFYYKSYYLLIPSLPYLFMSILTGILVYPRINYLLGAIIFLCLTSGYIMIMQRGNKNRTLIV